MADARAKRDAARPIAVQARTLDTRAQRAKLSLATNETERLKAEQALEDARAATDAARAAVEGARRELAERDAELAKGCSLHRDQRERSNSSDARRAAF